MTESDFREPEYWRVKVIDLLPSIVIQNAGPGRERRNISLPPDYQTDVYISYQQKKISVKADTYDGCTPWLDYKFHFDAVAKINEW